MHPARAPLAGQQPTAASPPKPNVVTFPAKKQLQASPAGPRAPVGQPRKWLRIDEEGKSAYIKVQSVELSCDHCYTKTEAANFQGACCTCLGGEASAGRLSEHPLPGFAHTGPPGKQLACRQAIPLYRDNFLTALQSVDFSLSILLCMFTPGESSTTA